MSKLIGTNPNQVPSNADLGTAAFMDKKEFLLSKGSEMSAINAVIPKTAVDVFIYDTTKDSDGGAWRKRVQHTSWYNERLNTTTRGSRKEFPAVAVIVGTTTTVTIYDGDDASLPMWMVFNKGGSWTTSANLIATSASNVTACHAVNATLAVTMTAGYGVMSINFISELTHSIQFNVDFPYLGNIASRNSGSGYAGSYSTKYILAGTVNDVAMTVLPNAPIDPATGLPVPTIAVATAGGVSVIKDDGSVVDVMTSNSYGVAFTKNHELIHTVNDASSTFTNHIREIPSADTTATATRRYYRAGNQTGSIPSISGTSSESTADILAALPNYTLAVASNATSVNTQNGASALNIIHELPADPTKGMIAYVTSDYNTGWMVGDIKLAALTDTNATDISSANLNPYTQATGSYGAITLDPKKTYKITITGYGDIDGQWPGYGAAIGGVHVYTGSTASPGVNQANLNIQDGGTSGSPISTTVYVRNFSSWTFNTWSTGTVTGYSISECDYNRSVYNNPIEVFGTITKTPVMPGADLVGYSGFSSSNYLRQPYNTALNFGTGSYSVMGWFKTDATNSTGVITQNGPSDADENLMVYIAPSNYGIYFDYGVSNQYAYLYQATDRALVADTTWHHFVCHVSAGGAPKVYVDGIDKALQVGGNAPSTFTFDTDYLLNIGTGRGTANSIPFGGSIALLRISATVPSLEQIKKIYNDEKFLFQENAKCTLYGTSDAVTALAYDDDTELLHVGTSAGRSDFQGLRRINNTTRAIGTAISAVDGFIVEE